MVANHVLRVSGIARTGNKALSAQIVMIGPKTISNIMITNIAIPPPTASLVFIHSPWVDVKLRYHNG
jgi:hypothetical protein